MSKDKELYILMDDPTPDDEIMTSVQKHFKIKKELPALTDSYGDLSVYTEGLGSLMSTQAKESLYGDGVQKKGKRVSKIKEAVLAVLQAEPNRWFSANECTAAVNGKVKSISEVLRAALSTGEVVRKTHKAGNMNRGFLWKFRTPEDSREDALAEADEPIATVQPVEIEPTPEWTEPKVWDNHVDAFATPAPVPQVADLGAFLTQKGKDTAQAERVQETPLEAPVEAIEEAIQPHALEDEPLDMEAQVERDLQAIFADDYFAALVHRVVLDGPANVMKKVTVLRTLAILLSKHIDGMEYAKELHETADYLASLDEVKHYY